MPPISPSERLALEAIRDAKLAWSMLAALDRAGVELLDLVALERAGLVAWWDLPRGRAVTLTPLAARHAFEACLGVVDCGASERPRWCRVDPDSGDPVEPQPLYATRARGEVRLNRPEFVEAEARRTSGKSRGKKIRRPEPVMDGAEPLTIWGVTVYKMRSKPKPPRKKSPARRRAS